MAYDGWSVDSGRGKSLLHRGEIQGTLATRELALRIVDLLNQGQDFGDMIRLLRLMASSMNLIQLNQGEMIMDLTRLNDAVANATTVEESAVTLLQQLGDLIRQSAGDPAALEALASQLDSEASALADAVAANTPAGEGAGEEAAVPEGGVTSDDQAPAQDSAPVEDPNSLPSSDTPVPPTA